LSLLAGDKMYCWQWVTLLAILSRATGIDSVLAEVRSFSNKKLEKNFSIGSRSVLLPICLNWALFPIVPPLEALVRKIETFTVAQATREVVNR
jgi:K+-transporting ATPase A subunit